MASFGDVLTGVLVSELTIDDDFVMSDSLNKQHILIQNLLYKKRQSRKKLIHRLAHVSSRKRRGFPFRRRRFVQGADNDASLDHDYINGSVPRFCSDEFEEFRTHFKIQRSTFDKIVAMVAPNLGNPEKASLPIERKVLVSMWMLSSRESFRTIGDKFGLQKSTTYYAFTQFISILNSLSKAYVFWPDSDSLGVIAGEFQRLHGFPGVLGVLDACHVPVKISADEKVGGGSDNRLESHSTVALQAVCDHRTRFMDIHVGYPQPNHVITCNWKFFEESDLGVHLSNDEWDVPEGCYLVGNATYHQRKYLLSPYPEGEETEVGEEARIKLNEALRRMRAVARRAFAAVRARFARLNFVDASRHDLVPQMIVSACVLHNIILEEEGEEESPAAAQIDKNDDDEEERAYGILPADDREDAEALAMRDAVAKALL